MLECFRPIKAIHITVSAPTLFWHSYTKIVFMAVTRRRSPVDQAVDVPIPYADEV